MIPMGQNFQQFPMGQNFQQPPITNSRRIKTLKGLAVAEVVLGFVILFLIIIEMVRVDGLFNPYYLIPISIGIFGIITSAMIFARHFRGKRPLILFMKIIVLILDFSLLAIIILSLVFIYSSKEDKTVTEDKREQSKKLAGRAISWIFVITLAIHGKFCFSEFDHIVWIDQK